MKTRLILLTILIIIIAGTVLPVSAFQTGDVRLNVQRRFGFSSGSQIRGSVALDIVTSITVLSVKYSIDGQVIAEVTQSPFTHVFQTTSYPVGWHDLSATVQTADNRTLQTDVRRFEFVSAEVEGQVVSGIVIPLLAVVALVTIIGAAVQFVGFKKGQNQLPLGAPRNYGVLGGTICPKCRRPFARHIWGLNLIAGKLDRCDYCGKWSLTRRMSSQELALAEAEELKLARPDSSVPSKNQTDKTQQMIDDSKYQDL